MTQAALAEMLELVQILKEDPQRLEKLAKDMSVVEAREKSVNRKANLVAKREEAVENREKKAEKRETAVTNKESTLKAKETALQEANLRLANAQAAVQARENRAATKETEAGNMMQKATRMMENGEKLRDKFTGKPEHVVNYLLMVAEEARRIMAGWTLTPVAHPRRAFTPPPFRPDAPQPTRLASTSATE